jgi:hypothetical protein
MHGCDDAHPPAAMLKAAELLAEGEKRAAFFHCPRTDVF